MSVLWSPEDLRPPQPKGVERRTFLRSTLTVAGSVVADGLNGAVSDALRPDHKPIEQDKITTPKLALVMGGIGRQDAYDIAGALMPSLANKETTVASLVYPNATPNAKESASAIRATGCKDLTLILHSASVSHGFSVLQELRTPIREGVLNKPQVILLHTPFTGDDVQNPAAEAASYLPMGKIIKSIFDLAVYGGLKDVAVAVEEKQLDWAVDFNGAQVLPYVIDLMGPTLYIGDAHPDGVINTPQAAQGYESYLSSLLTVALAPGIGHADPAKNPAQASFYNETITNWQNSLALAA